VTPPRKAAPPRAEPRVVDRLERRVLRYDRPLTRADFEGVPPPDGKAELLDGQVLVMSPDEWHGAVQPHVAHLLKRWDYDRARRAGTRPGRVVTETDYEVVAPDDPERSRAPDVAYTRPERLSGPPVPGHPRAHPDLAVEVLGLYTDREPREKLEEYRATGIPLVWVLDPGHRTATVYHNRPEGQTVEPLDPDGVLTGGDAVPGLAVPLREAFEVLDEPDDA
jgi:Uma2 family endonuclease